MKFYGVCEREVILIAFKIRIVSTMNHHDILGFNTFQACDEGEVSIQRKIISPEQKKKEKEKSVCQSRTRNIFHFIMKTRS